ncbi:MAG: hypothetical protein KJ737_17730 [Proteobacteria bacterium]|nr:hypothetical protein [Pseudomonadota bacterium]
MNFFRSEEHLDKWNGLKKNGKEGIIELETLMKLFSGPYFQKRREPDYFSHMGEYLADMIASLDQVKNAGNFWRMRSFEKLGLTLGQKLGIM